MGNPKDPIRAMVVATQATTITEMIPNPAARDLENNIVTGVGGGEKSPTHLYRIKIKMGVKTKNCMSRALQKKNMI